LQQNNQAEDSHLFVKFRTIRLACRSRSAAISFQRYG
jgi:hypothetical protein